MKDIQINNIRRGIIRHGYIEITDFYRQVHWIPLAKQDIDLAITMLQYLKEELKEFEENEIRYAKMRREDETDQ